MDFFDLLLSSPPPKKKQKIGEHGVNPQLSFTPQKQEVVDSTDVKNEVVEQAHGPVLKKCGQRAGKRRRNGVEDTPLKKKSLKPGVLKSEMTPQTLEQRLKNLGLDKEFTVSGSSRLGCMACMKYAAWREQEGADTKKKKKKEKKTKILSLKKPVHTEEVKSPEKSHGPAEADGDDEESKHADIQHSLQKGTYQPVGQNGQKLKFILRRHLSGARHKTATGARANEENVNNRDVPSDAQMRFIYDEVKKNPMVPSPCCLVDTRAYSLNLFRTPSRTMI